MLSCLIYTCLTEFMDTFHKCSNIHEKIDYYCKFSHLCLCAFFYNLYSIVMKNRKTCKMCCWNVYSTGSYSFLYSFILMFVFLPFASTNILIANVKIRWSPLWLDINHLCVQSIFILDWITLSASAGQRCHHRAGLRVLLPPLATFISIQLNIYAAKVWFFCSAQHHVHMDS